MQAKGQDIRAVIELGRFPGIVVGVRKEHRAYKSAADLKGMKIGVTAPGSSTNMFVRYLMAKAGLKPDDAAYHRRRQRALGGRRHPEGRDRRHLQPRSGDHQARAGRATSRSWPTRRTEEGTRAMFGGSNPAAVLYIKQDFIDKNPNTVQALVNAFYKTLKWIEKATPEQIAATVPEEY